MAFARWQIIRCTALVVVVFLVKTGLSADPDTEARARMRRDINFLASDECEGRGVETKGIARAADYIVAAFKEAGLKPGGPDNSYFQPFKITGRAVLDGTPSLRLRGPLGQEIDLKAD